jgi:hypothetical protein
MKPIIFWHSPETIPAELYAEFGGSCGCDGALDDGCPLCTKEKKAEWLAQREAKARWGEHGHARDRGDRASLLNPRFIVGELDPGINNMLVLGESNVSWEGAFLDAAFRQMRSGKDVLPLPIRAGTMSPEVDLWVPNAFTDDWEELRPATRIIQVGTREAFIVGSVNDYESVAKVARVSAINLLPRPVHADKVPYEPFRFREHAMHEWRYLCAYAGSGFRPARFDREPPL